jgi:hypothetical protein
VRSDSPWEGEEPWQSVFRSVIASWRERLSVGDRLPAGWSSARAARPDTEVLSAAGFLCSDRVSLSVPHRWSVGALAGFVYSTSFLPRSVFGERAAEFEAELGERLAGELVSDVSYAFDFASRPY